MFKSLIFLFLLLLGSIFAEDEPNRFTKEKQEELSRNLLECIKEHRLTRDDVEKFGNQSICYRSEKSNKLYTCLLDKYGFVDGGTIKWADFRGKVEALYEDEKDKREGNEFFDNCAPVPGSPLDEAAGSVASCACTMMNKQKK